MKIEVKTTTEFIEQTHDGIRRIYKEVRELQNVSEVEQRLKEHEEIRLQRPRHE